PRKAHELRERFAFFQISKKAVLRKTGQDLFATMRDVDKEALARLRRSLFGDNAAASYDLFLNRLLYTEDGRDDYVNAEHYVMLGNYERDPDRFQTMLEISSSFVELLQPSGFQLDETAYDTRLSDPGNAQELFAGGVPDESTDKGKSQRALLNGWVQVLEGE